jgi:hypothetical protein
MLSVSVKPSIMNARNLAVTLVFLALGYGIWHFHSDAGRLMEEMDRLKTDHALALAAKDQELQRSLSAQNEQHQKAIQSLNDDHDQKLNDLRQDQRKQIASAYKEFENIFAGNKKTLDYINLLEAKVQAGQVLSKVEVEKLVVITSGISFLQKQYQKPLQEFTALYLVHELHFGGVGDQGLLNHRDWRIFGLEPYEVLQQLRAVAARGRFVVQHSGQILRIAWGFHTMEDFLNAAAQREL